MRPGPVADGWAGSLFPEPIAQAKPILPDDNSKVLALLRNERGELYCNCYGMIVRERKCHKCVGYASERDTCRWVMSVHNAELVNGKPQWVEAEPARVVESVKEQIAVLLDGKWYSDGKLLWDCSDCLCLSCANEGKSCHDCKGFERCKKIGGTGGKIGACPDFRTEEGKEQHCLENGCLCFTCQLIGTDCEQCAGPIRCDKPRMKCKEYVGAEVEA